jgi:hypothetical protein
MSGAEIQSFAEATTTILATRFNHTQNSVRPVAWLACVTLGNVGRTLVGTQSRRAIVQAKPDRRGHRIE